MVIDIYNPNKELSLKLGDVIVAKHERSGKTLYYKLIEEGRSGNYRLLSLTSYRIMKTFKSKDPLSAIAYIAIAVSAEIIDIVPESKLKLTTI